MWDFVQESYFWILPEVVTKAAICINPVRQNMHEKVRQSRFITHRQAAKTEA